MLLVVGGALGAGYYFKDLKKKELMLMKEKMSSYAASITIQYLVQMQGGRVTSFALF